VSKDLMTQDLGSGAERCGGSSPPSRTKYQWLSPENRAYNCVQMVNLRTNCVQNKEEIEDFTWRMSDCEELVWVTHRRWWGRPCEE